MANDQEDSTEPQNALSMIFGTPFVSYQWSDSDEFNMQLAELVLGRESSESHGRGVRSNAGGWQSAGNIMSWNEPCITTLKGRIEQLVFNIVGEILQKDGRERSFSLLTDCWANVCRRGDYNVVHSHPNTMWSVAYYVAAGEADKSIPYSGLLELLDPRESANYIQVQNTILDARTFIDNIPGRMIAFPSWVKRMVYPFVSDGVRISIAANVNVVENNPQQP